MCWSKKGNFISWFLHDSMDCIEPSCPKWFCAKSNKSKMLTRKQVTSKTTSIVVMWKNGRNVQKKKQNSGGFLLSPDSLLNSNWVSKIHAVRDSIHIPKSYAVKCVNCASNKIHAYVHIGARSSHIYVSWKYLQKCTMKAASENRSCCRFSLRKEYTHRNGGYFGGVFICALLVTIGYSTNGIVNYVATEHVLRLRTYVRRWCMARHKPISHVKIQNFFDGISQSYLLGGE